MFSPVSWFAATSACAVSIYRGLIYKQYTVLVFWCQIHIKMTDMWMLRFSGARLSLSLPPPSVSLSPPESCYLSLWSVEDVRGPVWDRIDPPLTPTSKQTNKQHHQDSVQPERLPCSLCVCEHVCVCMCVKNGKKTLRAAVKCFISQRARGAWKQHVSAWIRSFWL